MSRKHIISRPTKNQDISYDDIYDEITSQWDEKSKDLQIRMRRALKNEMKGM